MESSRYIPDIEVPEEQTCASLRKLLRESHGRERKLREALTGLLADITEYQTINNLGGENNHWQVTARKALSSEYLEKKGE